MSKKVRLEESRSKLVPRTFLRMLSKWRQRVSQNQISMMTFPRKRASRSTWISKSLVFWWLILLVTSRLPTCVPEVPLFVTLRFLSSTSCMALNLRLLRVSTCWNNERLPSSSLWTKLIVFLVGNRPPTILSWTHLRNNLIPSFVNSTIVLKQQRSLLQNKDWTQNYFTKIQMFENMFPWFLHPPLRVKVFQIYSCCWFNWRKLVWLSRWCTSVSSKQLYWKSKSSKVSEQPLMWSWWMVYCMKGIVLWCVGWMARLLQPSELFWLHNLCANCVLR